VKLSHEDTAKIEVLMDVAIATIFWLSTYGVHNGAKWQIQLYHLCVVAMRPYVTLL